MSAPAMRAFIFSFLFYHIVKEVNTRASPQLSSEDQDAIFARIADLLSGGVSTPAPTDISVSEPTTTSSPPPPRIGWELELEAIRSEKNTVGLTDDPLVWIQLAQKPDTHGYVRLSELEKLRKVDFEVCMLNKNLLNAGSTIFTSSNSCGLADKTVGTAEDSVNVNATFSSKADAVVFDYDTIRRFLSGSY